MLAFIQNFIELFTLSAPWLLIGLFVAGLMKAWLPTDWLQKQLGGQGAKPIIKAALIGAPLPLCSCGVIPAAMQLRRNGASKGATVAFLSSTPETGVDSISVSYVMLGPVMAIVRPVAAILSAITAGLLVEKSTQSTTNNTEKAPCCSKKIEIKTATCCEKPTQLTPAPKSSCCSTTKTSSISDIKNESKLTEFLQRTKAGLQYSTGKLLSDFYLWLLIGLFFAALIQTLVPMDVLASYGNSIWMMLLMVLISVPMYICATASTPIAAALMMMGISPGAALVFMQAGPATNIATISVVYKELGKRALAAYLFGVIVMSVFFGWLLDTALNYFDISVKSVMQHQHSLLPSWLDTLAAILLLVLIIRVIGWKLSKKEML